MRSLLAAAMGRAKAYIKDERYPIMLAQIEFEALEFLGVAAAVVAISVPGYPATLLLFKNLALLERAALSFGLGMAISTITVFFFSFIVPINLLSALWELLFISAIMLGLHAIFK